MYLKKRRGKRARGSAKSSSKKTPTMRGTCATAQSGKSATGIERETTEERGPKENRRNRFVRSEKKKRRKREREETRKKGKVEENFRCYSIRGLTCNWEGGNDVVRKVVGWERGEENSGRRRPGEWLK